MHHRGNSRSERTAALLRESGQNAKALGSGFLALEAAGYPVTRAIALVRVPGPRFCVQTRPESFFLA